MKSIVLLVLSVFCFSRSVTAETSQTGGTWFFSVPTKEVEKVRAMARDPKDGADVNLVNDTLREKAGVEVISHWWNWPRWDDREFTMRSYRFINRGGSRDFDTEEDALLKLRLKGDNGVGLLSLGLNCIGSLNPEGRDYLRFSSDSGLVPVLEGRWCEMAAWEQGDKTWLLWQRFPDTMQRAAGKPDVRESSSTLPDGAAEDPTVRAEAHFRAHAEQAFTVELLFFKTSPATVAQLAKAGPDSRGKAAEWMLTRGPVWRKLRICQRADGEKRAWSMSHEKLSGSGKSAEKVFNSALNLDVSGKHNEGVLSMDITVNRVEGDPSAAWMKEELALEKVGSGWNFIPLEKNGAVNVMVYREVEGW